MARMTAQRCSADWSSSSSPVSTATSTTPQSRYTWRTAWPTGSRASRTGAVLPVAVAEPASAQERAAAPLHEEARQFEIAFPAGHAVQLHEGHLDLRVPVHELTATRPELLPEALDDAVHDAQEAVVPEAALPGHGGLRKMPGHVQLVAPFEVAELASRQVGLVVRVEVAVLALRPGDELDGRFGQGAKRLIRSLVELPADGLEPLVDVE